MGMGKDTAREYSEIVKVFFMTMGNLKELKNLLKLSSPAQGLPHTPSPALYFFKRKHQPAHRYISKNYQPQYRKQKQQIQLPSGKNPFAHFPVASFLMCYRIFCHIHPPFTLCLPQPERVSVRYSAADKCALSPAPLPAHAVLTAAFSLPMQLPVF